MEREENPPLDKDSGRLSRLDWYSWELCAESLEISESDNVIACAVINEAILAKMKIKAHYSSFN